MWSKTYKGKLKWLELYPADSSVGILYIVISTGTFVLLILKKSVLLCLMGKRERNREAASPVGSQHRVHPQIQLTSDHGHAYALYTQGGLWAQTWNLLMWVSLLQCHIFTTMPSSDPCITNFRTKTCSS